MIRAIDEYNENGHLIYADNYIGAFVRGKTREEALQKFPQEIARYCAWRRLPQDAYDVEIVQEKISPLQICDADSDVLFESEQPPLTQAEYDTLKALALQSARDFLLLYESIDDKDGTTLPPRSTFYGDVPRTARQMYEHAKNVNSYYFSEIGVKAANEPDIYASRLAGFAALEQQPDYLSNRVTAGSYDEAWSLRKVCRRFVWHDRIHARALYRMAAALCGAQSIENPFCF